MPANTKDMAFAVTGKVRLSYVHIKEPYAGPESNQDPKYSLCILIPKNDAATLSKVNRGVESAIETGITSKWNGHRPATLKLPLRDGDIERADREEYRGHFFINCSSKNQPEVVDANLNKILNLDEVYSGCYGRVSVRFFPFSTRGNNGVACGLRNLQKLEDGEPLGGRTRAEDDFSSDEEDWLN